MNLPTPKKVKPVAGLAKAAIRKQPRKRAPLTPNVPNDAAAPMDDYARMVAAQGI